MDISLHQLFAYLSSLIYQLEHHLESQSYLVSDQKQLEVLLDEVIY